LIDRISINTNWQIKSQQTRAMSDYDNLNPQIKKLLEETGTKISNAKDLQALSNVSVRDLAKLFDELAKNNKSSKPQSKQDIFKLWTQNMVEKHSGGGATSSKPIAKDIEIDLSKDNVILSDEEFKNRQSELRKAEKELDGMHNDIDSARESAIRAALNGDEKALQQAQKKLTQLKSKKRNLVEKSGNVIRDKAFYQTIFFKKSPRLQKLGPVSKSSVPEVISSELDPLEVEVVKHVLDNHIVIQLNCKNKNPKRKLENLTVSNAELGQSLELEFCEDISALQAENPDAVFLAFKRKKPEDIATGNASGTIEYTETEVDPKTGKPTGTARKQKIPLPEFSLSAADYVIPGDSPITFDKDFDSLKSKEKKINVAFGPEDDIEEALQQLADLLGIEPYDKKLSDRGLERHTTNFCGSVKKGNSKKQVLMKADISKDKDGNVVAELSIRSDDPEFGQDIAQALQKILETQRKKKAAKAKELEEKVKNEKNQQSGLGNEQQQERPTGIVESKQDQERRKRELTKLKDRQTKAYDNDLSKIPELQKLGIPHTTSEPVPLTDKDDEYTVECIKHVYPENIVLQFTTTNHNKGEQKIDDSFVEIDSGDAKGLKQKSVIKGNCDPKTGKGSSFVVFEKPKDGEPSGTLQNKLTFTMGEYEGGKVGEMNDYQLDIFELPLSVKDYVLPTYDDNSFKDKWQKLGKEKENHGIFSTPATSLEEAIENIVSACPQLLPVGGITKGENDTVQLSGILPTGEPVLVECKLSKKGGEVQIDAVIRTASKDARDNMLNSINEQLDEQRKKKLQFDEDMENPYYRDVFSLIPALKNLGAPKVSHTPIVVNNDAQLHVDCIKHFWKENIVLQFICTNKMQDKEFEQVMVETDETQCEGVDKEFFVQAGLLVYNQPEHVFMCFSYEEGTTPSGPLTNALKYDIRKIDPRTGRPVSEDTSEGETHLTDITIGASDYPK
jgi:hypothetical protein